MTVPVVSYNGDDYSSSTHQAVKKARPEPGLWCQTNSSWFELWLGKALEPGMSSLALLHLSSSTVKWDNCLTAENFHKILAQCLVGTGHSLIRGGGGYNDNNANYYHPF